MSVELRHGAAHLAETLARLRANVDKLLSGWTGASQVHFRTTYEDWLRSQGVLTATLDAMAEMLEMHANALAGTEVSLATSLTGGTTGGALVERAEPSDLEAMTSWVSELAEGEHVSSAEALDALRPLVTSMLHTRRRAVGAVDDLARALTPSLVDVDPVPRAAVEQARRRAALRTSLLSGGALTYAALAEGRGMSREAVRQFVRRARAQSRLFTVNHDGETLVPAFLLDEDFESRPVFRDAIEVLTAAGEDGWALWAWFVTPSAWLDGEVPASLATEDAGRLVEAAQRRAANAA